MFDAGNELRCIASRQFKTPILSLAFSCKGHLAVCLSNHIFLFMYAEKNVPIKSITCHNPDGIFALSDDGHLLAFPVAPNEICIRFSDGELCRITTKSPFCKLRFNPKGACQDFLAAVSEEGKTVWVWSLQRKEKKVELTFEFTRGFRQCKVEGLDFNSFSTLLSLSTDSGTVHVFELSVENRLTEGYLGCLRWAKSKYQVRVDPPYHALACLLVDEKLLPDGSQPRRSVFVLTSTGELCEYTLPKALEQESDAGLPIRIMNVFRE